MRRNTRLEEELWRTHLRNRIVEEDGTEWSRSGHHCIGGCAGEMAAVYIDRTKLYHERIFHC